MSAVEVQASYSVSEGVPHDVHADPVQVIDADRNSEIDRSLPACTLAAHAKDATEVEDELGNDKRSKDKVIVKRAKYPYGAMIFIMVAVVGQRY